VLCRNITAASSLLHIAIASGYRESGIALSGVATAQEKIIVAIRTNAVRLDVPLGDYNPQTGYIHLFGLGAEYLNSLLKLVNVKFGENESRKENLVKALQHKFKATESQSPAETKEERRRRKREEGLRLQGLKNQKQVTYYEKRNIDALDDDLPLGSPATL
jgi:tRNA(Phe) wybutosine-synthesizing methylase Tyw3